MGPVCQEDTGTQGGSWGQAVPRSCCPLELWVAVAGGRAAPGGFSAAVPSLLGLFKEENPYAKFDN